MGGGGGDWETGDRAHIYIYIYIYKYIFSNYSNFNLAQSPLAQASMHLTINVGAVGKSGWEGFTSEASFV